MFLSLITIIETITFCKPGSDEFLRSQSMMRKSFLYKTGFLVILLAVILVVIGAAIRLNLNSTSDGNTQKQTFLEQFIIAGGPIVWFVLLPISFIAVYLAAEYCITIRREKLVPDGVGDSIARTIQMYGCQQLETRIADQKDVVSVAVVQAVLKGRGDWFRMRSVLAESLQDQALEFLRKIEWINLIGNVSPMVGLFGTVFGMIKLFNAIVVAGGQPQPAQLAGGISVALVTTFWGLFIAIPALAIHGIFRNRIETLISNAVVESDKVMPQIRKSLQKQSPVKSQRNIKDIRGEPAGPTGESALLR